MDSIWIDSLIMALPKRTPAERLLLARICYRAAGQGGVCTDSNGKLGEAIGIHAQSVSEAVKRLDEMKLVTASVDAARANLRSLTPAPHLLSPYLKKFARYKGQPAAEILPAAPAQTPEETPADYQPNAHSDYQPSPYSPRIDYKPNTYTPISLTLIAYKPNTHSTISLTLIGYKPNPYSSIYIRIREVIEKNKRSKTKQPLSEGPSADADGVVVVSAENQLDSPEKKEGANTPPSGAPPQPTIESVRADLLGSSAHRRLARERYKLTRPATESADYADLVELFLDQQESGAEASKPIFPQPDRIRKHFQHWLGKQQEIQSIRTSKSNGKSHPSNPAAGRVEPVPGQSFGNWTGSRFGKSTTDAG